MFSTKPTLTAAIFVSVFLVLTSGTARTDAQIIDSVTFEGVVPDPNGSGEFRTHVLADGGLIRSLRYFGTIFEENTATYVNEVTVNIAAAGSAIANQAISEIADFAGSIDFSGIIPVEQNFDPGDLWSFSFFETFDDGGDQVPDANLNITFEFSEEPAPMPTVSDLGAFGLGPAFYQRSGGIAGSYPYGIVPFRVSQSGDYQLNVDWFNAASQSFDGYLYLLDSPFAGSDESAIAFNDDFVTTAVSRLNAQLQTGQTYYALMTTFSPVPDPTGLVGNFSLSTFDGGTAAVAIPEPTVAPLLIALLAATTKRRRP
jgi:hypothetical protein